MNVSCCVPKSCAGNGSPMPALFTSMVATPRAAITAAGWAKEAGIPVVADLDELYPDVEQLIEKVDYLIVSRNIPGQLTGKSDLRESLLRDPASIRLSSDGGNARAGWGSGLGRTRFLLSAGVACRSGRYNRSRRHLSCRIYLRPSARIAAGANARLCLRGRSSELHGRRSTGRHSTREQH